MGKRCFDTVFQKKEAISPAEKYSLSKDQEEAVEDVVQGVLQYALKGRNEGALTLLLGPAGTGKTTCIVEIIWSSLSEAR